MKPTMIGWGMNSISRPSFSRPIAITMKPAQNVAAISTGRPWLAMMPAITVMKAAAGPETWNRELPNTAAIAPPTTPETRPAIGLAPEAIAKAMQSGWLRPSRAIPMPAKPRPLWKVVP